jgi:hypothetical protein
MNYVTASFSLFFCVKFFNTMKSFFTILASACIMMALELGTFASAELTTVNKGNLFGKRTVMGAMGRIGHVGGRMGAFSAMGRMGHVGGRMGAFTVGGLAQMGQARIGGVNGMAGPMGHRRGY